ncbi:hypothetical protein SpCBS45565_g07243 [Spizellomyces sp. 'palustris']|nr:hypothetical protein SpCBS45565_g07243 [Spizellomyces sp. 'palustris']
MSSECVRPYLKAGDSPQSLVQVGIRTIATSTAKDMDVVNFNIAELIDIWDELIAYLESILISQRSTTFPGFGFFHVKRLKKKTGEMERISCPLFFPSRMWGKVPGYDVKRHPSALEGISAPELFNFAGAASRCRRSRETVDLAIKDLVHALLRILRRGSTVILRFNGIGKLHFRQGTIRFIFSTDFLSNLNGTTTSDKLPLPFDGKRDDRTPEPASCSDPRAINSKQRTDLDPQEDKTGIAGLPLKFKKLSESVHYENPTGSTLTRPDSTASQRTKIDDQGDRAVTAGIGNKFVGGKNQQVITVEGDNRPFKFLIRSGTHTHAHSGDRLWNDENCPICRHRSMPIVDLREQRARKEKEQDRLMLHLSLDLDKEFVLKARANKQAKLETTMSTAEYNRTKAAEKEVIRKSEQQKVPVGNLFEDRELGPDVLVHGRLIAAGLQEQIAANQLKKEHERVQRDYENKVLNQRLSKELIAYRVVFRLSTAEIESHIEKLKRRQQQQDILAEQIRSRQQLQQHSPEPALPNPFARSENLMYLYQKEKAKQLYQEQLAIIKQRREYEARVADMERQHSLDRLTMSRHELEKDLRNMKRANYEQRKSLEAYWTEQLRFKNRLQSKV